MRNKARRTRVRNAVKAVRLAVEKGDLEAARTAYQSMVPVVDKMVGLGILHKNKAARTKSRLNQQIHTMSLKAE